ncbi:DUF3426 domain-containing protein [Piscinibacter aquaticus]|uniref:DUF3426 domain-containing protein n=1 Tax=Piscinibacter aquaticus TaxID=392597 RepID=A0A5C6TZP2_9BURK|nr:DUF3426 domain-containing protein [Piscinibacter aquaticus]
MVQDQLKVSEGWVRCGRCNEVFNALEGLFDLDRDSPPEWSESKQMTPASAPFDEEREEEQPDPDLVDKIDEQLLGTSRRTGFGALTGLGGPDRSKKGPDFADARFDTDVPDDALAPLPDLTSARADGPSSIDPDEAPAFVREAEREARWQSSGMRRLLGLLAFALSLLLAGQAAHHYRDAVAARLLARRPPCTRGARGRAARSRRRGVWKTSSSSTALAKAAAGDAFRFSVVLRNRATTVAALPWLELTLTDANGELLARRALNPRELRARSAEIGPGAETTLQTTISTGALRVTGYTVEIFYP